MDSSTVAFERFRKWKKWMTVLNLTISNQSGIPDIFSKQQIFFVDEEEQIVAFVGILTHDNFRLDLEGADFVVSERRVEATRPDEGCLVIEEELLS